jgi:hypothetical protein
MKLPFWRCSRFADLFLGSSPDELDTEYPVEVLTIHSGGIPAGEGCAARFSGRLAA